MRVTVVVPTFRRPERALRLLHALAGQSLPPEDYEVVVVDDASGDGSAARVADELASMPFAAQLVEAVRNRGPGPARNLGWRHSSRPYLAFVDDDCVPEPGWLAAGLAVLEADPALGLVQGRTGIPAGSELGHLAAWSHSQIIDGPTPFFEACNIFYRRRALEDAGGFDETHARWGEDSAAAWAAIEAGWGTAFASDARVAHDLERRGWRWHVQTGLGDRAMVALASRFPGYRQRALWRPWAIRRADAALALAVLGLVGAIRWRPALTLTVPWLTIWRPSLRRPRTWPRLAEHAAVDAAHLVGALVGSWEHRCLIL